MTISRIYYQFLLAGLIIILSLPVDAQWITIARKVKTMRTGDTDIATVIIDAGTSNVYRAVIDTLISAAVSQGIRSQKKTDIAVNAIVGVCHKMGIKCELEE